MSNGVTIIVQGDSRCPRCGHEHHGEGHGEGDHVFTIPNIYHVLQLIREDISKLSEADCRIIRELGEIKILLNYIVRLIGDFGPPPNPEPGFTLSLSPVTIPVLSEMQSQSGSPSTMPRTTATAQFPPLPDDSSDIDHLEVTPTYAADGQTGESQPVLTFPKDATTGDIGVFNGPGHLSASLVYVDADGARSVHPSVAELDIPDEVPPNMPPPDPGTFGFTLEQVPDEG
jgi:hypothetical protein